MVKFHRLIASEDLPDEHSAKARRELIDQSSDPQLVIRDHSLARVEDPANVHSHLGFLIGAGKILELADDRSVGAAYFDHSFHVQHINSRLGDLFQRIVALLLFQRLDQDHTVLIHFRQIIPVLDCKEARQHFRRNGLRLRFDLKDHDRPANAVRDVKLLGAVMDIHKEKVVEKKVLEEIIAVKFLLISDNEVLQLTDRDFGDHKSILIVALRDEDESKFFIVHHLEIIAAADDLAVNS